MTSSSKSSSSYYSSSSPSSSSSSSSSSPFNSKGQFDPYSPTGVTNANNYNPYNSAGTTTALTDAQKAASASAQQQLDTSKNAATFGAVLGTNTIGAQQQQAAGLQSQQQQQQQLNSTISSLSPTSGKNTGYLAFGGIANQPPPAPAPVPALTQYQRDLQSQSAQTNNQAYLNSLNNQQQLQASNQQQVSDRLIAQTQADTQKDVANINAQAQIVSSLFGSLGSMSGGGHHTYW